MPPDQPLWTRVEPYSRDRGLEQGLNAEVHDPLWLLARQWQLREFAGEDAGSPVWAELTTTCAPITRFLPRPPGMSPSQIQEYDGSVPLETLVEQEPIRSAQELVPPLRLAAEAGLQFLRLLKAHGAETLRSKVIEEFPLQALTDKEKTSLDSDTVRYMEVMANRVPDGRVLKTQLPAWTVPPELRDKVEAAKAKWMTWYDALFYEAKSSSWVPARLEYQAQISAATPKGEVVLDTTEYADGHLDWYSFDAIPNASLGARSDDATTIQNTSTTQRVIPTPVRFHGMPASRYWEFEDANIDFGAIAAGEQQLAHLLLIEFGLVSGDDWFVIPVRLPVGTLCYTDSLTVSDTFGIPTRIQSARAVDQEIQVSLPELSPWDLFHVSGDTSKTDALFLPPTLGKSLQGKSIEEVLFMRDEMANMVWAVERTVESALNLPLNRSEIYFQSRDKDKERSAVGPEATLTRLYKLASQVPPHWVPMLPVPINGNYLGLKMSGQGNGRVVTELQGTTLYGEEVPREGVRISRAYQYTRWTNGESYLWVGRRNEVGRGEGSSGLVFDQLEPPSEPSNQGPP